MSDDFAEFIAEYRNNIERHLTEQIARHLNVDQTVDPKRVVEIQIWQEQEKLEQALEKWDEVTPAQVKMFRLLIDQWLPELGQKLKGRH